MMTTERPTYMITKEKPGTELAAETAAGLAAASIFLNKTHPELAQTALQHASELFEFADKYRYTRPLSLHIRINSTIHQNSKYFHYMTIYIVDLIGGNITNQY